MDYRDSAGEAAQATVNGPTAANGAPNRQPAQPSQAIDWRFPEQFVDDLSRREVFNKHLFRPNTYLHKWWARRCGSTFRTILKQFAPRAERRDYYAAGGLEGLTVLDPMMGGGTTLHEAIRMGANVVGADIDPIPVLQARASLSRIALPALRRAFDRFFADLHADLHAYFQTHCPTCNGETDIRYCLYGVRKRCECGTVIQVEQYDLRQDERGTTRLDPRSGGIVSDSAPRPAGAGAGRLIKKGDKKYPSCNRAYAELDDVPFHARYALVAVVGECAQHGLFYRTPSQHDLRVIAKADRARSKLDFGALEDFLVRDGPKSGDLIRHNVRSYLDVFSSRQLLYLHSAATHLQRHKELERLNLAMLVSTSLEFNSMLCGYKGWHKNRPGAIRHTFGLHAYSFQYTALENNPVNPAKSSGNLRRLFSDRIERGRKWGALPVERKVGADGKQSLVSIPGETDTGDEASAQSELAPQGGGFLVMQRDSRHLPLQDDSIDIVATDPPYYDSVQYADLAMFFRVWLARLLPDTAQWRYDHNQVAVAANTSGDESNFLRVLTGVFAECRRVLKPGAGRMVFTFHHWNHKAWTELTMALRSAGFVLTNAYVVFSEHPISMHIRNLKSIRHDCILVLASRTDAERHWVAPKNTTTDDSESFCRRCGETLGWLLERELPADRIRSEWRRLLENAE